ncbi:MAG: bifunctional phosphopantothenoylcysteine decarboxylase/phosphopantothenate--cysteine ligase CoaBC [Gammaproteobacteria bacterium]|nr:bifunctional phosphopantothenoylcysteine decarboxylase/phosphopantothenate--cysteine ligase CoaBC [Gammaproteobacteria bacterium]
MPKRLVNKNILLGVTGGIAAYKSADLARRLREAGACVRVVMTQKAKEFITPLTMQAVSGNPVHDDLFDLQAEAAMGHIELARWADAILVAPATADFIARLRQGEANDLLTTLCLAASAPIALAPAMNQAMWKNTATQENVQAVQDKGVKMFGPDAGEQACGDVGYGRMLEPLELVKQLSELFETKMLTGVNVLMTAGPTQEAIDPVRYISNASSGKMGYALAQALTEAGAKVTLISGPVSQRTPEHVTRINVISAKEMYASVMNHVHDNDIFIGVAAVADYRCKTISSQKIAKTSEELQLVLERNPDIVASVAQLDKKPFVIGFAAETENLISHARAKLFRKKLDMIIANQVGGTETGIGSDENAVTVLWCEQQQEFKRMSKQKLARELVSLIAECYKIKNDELRCLSA